MTERNPGLVADPVFLGITRPPMRWGVTYSALLACGLVSIESFLVTRNLLWLLMYVPLAPALEARDAAARPTTRTRP